MNYLSLFTSWFNNLFVSNNSKKIEIPFKVSENELLVRGIVTPLHYSRSQKKLRREAFLPKEGNCDVSLLRHAYTDDNFCKKHAKELSYNGQEYIGLAAFLNKSQIAFNTEPQHKISAEVKGSPIDPNKNYITNPPVYITDIGLPMHADLVYSGPFPIKGEPQ